MDESESQLEFSPCSSFGTLSQPSSQSIEELAVTARRVKALTRTIVDAKDGWKGAEEALGLCQTVSDEVCVLLCVLLCSTHSNSQITNQTDVLRP